MTNIYEKRTYNGIKRVPVWFMRQAGRYHSHYQNLKRSHSFVELCKVPELACETTMGPIEDFKFDAAILFSDLLYPLENIGLGLEYNPGPILKKHVKSKEDLNNLSLIDPKDFYLFQKNASSLLREKLPSEKSLLGFIGSPFTLYAYACEGGHSGNLNDTKIGLYNGTFKQFSELILNEVIQSATAQIEGGVDTICIFDTAAGEVCLKDFEQFIVPEVKTLTSTLKKSFPHIKITYYSKFTNIDYLKTLEDDDIDTLGIDWRVSLTNALKTFSNDYFVQGNIDPSWLFLPNDILLNNLKEFHQHLTSQNLNLDKWIAGLGHGVLVKTPEKNVRTVVDFIQSNFKL